MKSAHDFSIRVYPNSNSRHVSPIYAGLYDLMHLSKIKLEFSRKLMGVPRDLEDKLLWMEVHDQKADRIRKVCFDMRDSGTWLSVDSINRADLYFKRSYDVKFIESLDENLKTKIHPYGLYYPCRSNNEIATLALKHLYHYHVLDHMLATNPIRAIRRILGYPLKLLIGNRVVKELSMNLHPISTSLEVDSKAPAQSSVLFLTRVWDTNGRSPEYAASRKELNDMRADTVRALKRRFKDRFIGGIQYSRFAEKHYPDCISTWETDKSSFLKLLKKCLVTVTTTGLHESNGAKLAEYVAASRCIVTEPLKQKLPTPLNEGRHILTFNDPDSCVEACERLLDDTTLAGEMRRNNEAYYRSELKPSVLMFKHLRTACEH